MKRATPSQRWSCSILEHTAVQSATELVTFAHEVVQRDLCDTLAIDAPNKLQQLEEHPHAFSLFWAATLHILTCKQQKFNDLPAQGMQQDRLNKRAGSEAVTWWASRAGQALYGVCRNATQLCSLVRSPC